MTSIRLISLSSREEIRRLLQADVFTPYNIVLFFTFVFQNLAAQMITVTFQAALSCFQALFSENRIGNCGYTRQPARSAAKVDSLCYFLINGCTFDLKESPLIVHRCIKTSRLFAYAF